MIIQGQITAVVPPDHSNQYGVQYQNITINTPTMGSVTGRIGTKTPYTQQNLGQQVQLECEKVQTQQGQYNKFKKYNPQYAQGGQSQPQGVSGTLPRDYNAENRGKCRTQFIKAAIIAGEIHCRNFEDVLTLTQFAMTGIIPQEYQSNPSQTEDDIPF